MHPNTQTRIQTWLEGNYDPETKASIQAMTDEEKNEAFYKTLEFGTGGLRGILGVGTNRVNRYTIGAATQGLSNYLKAHYGDREPLRAVIAYDSRHQSDTLAQVVADVFSANDIEVFIFEGIRPTPELSFAIRHLNCQTGVVLTASHNPKIYNGYKAYWKDGGQVVPPHDRQIIAAVEAIQSVDEIRFAPAPERIHRIGTEVDQAYRTYVCGLSVKPEVIQRQADACIVFSPLHGTGIEGVPQVLEALGFKNVHLVEEQCSPDGDFPTVVYPNPEEAEAMALGLAYAQRLKADVLMATDPDADRVGIAVRDWTGKFSLLNGNQTGALLIAYLLEAWQKANKLDGKQMVIKTIVTTDLIARVAQHYGVACYDTLTGFKYIAELIREKEGQETFIAGGEESYGYLIGDGVRDKDAVAACAIIAEMVAYAKDKGFSLFDWLIEIYQKYGCYQEGLFSLVREGKEGAEQIRQLMQDLRQNPPRTLGGSPVQYCHDYQSLQTRNLLQDQIQPLEGFPASNVLQFLTVDGAKVSVRPSGTEPKIKFYVSVQAPLPNKSDYPTVLKGLQQRIEAIKNDLIP
ncbi:MAG: phospho-sugar mutase [Bernardetiaceae bacterium]